MHKEMMLQLNPGSRPLLRLVLPTCSSGGQKRTVTGLVCEMCQLCLHDQHQASTLKLAERLLLRLTVFGNRQKYIFTVSIVQTPEDR